MSKRPLTAEEAREVIFGAIRFRADYWASETRRGRLDDIPGEDRYARLAHRVVHSVLAVLDGVTDCVPPLDLVASESDNPQWPKGLTLTGDCLLHDCYKP